jgi:hypothetical protein
MLRAKLLPGEVLVGWGAVERAAVGPAKTVQVGLGMAPVVGPLVVALLAAPKHRFVVLTDHRVIVLDARVGSRRGPIVIAETPIGTMRVSRTMEKRVFRVALDGVDAPQTIGVPKQRSKAAERMLEAMRVLALDDT